MIPSTRIISVGTLSCHPLWNESSPLRTGHATTTLVSAGDVHVIVDPSLPGQVVAARLSERSPLGPADMTHVFLTACTLERMRGLAAFPEARWLAFEPELAAARSAIASDIEAVDDYGDEEKVDGLRAMEALLERVSPATDGLAEGIDLFPLAGVTPGTCGLLLPEPTRTVLVTGDAVATREHLEKAQVLPDCFNREQAQESFKEAVEIADVIIPGRDDALTNPLRQRW